MTNKEAIRTLEANYPDACFEQLREAVDAAIEALKAQDAADDMVSKQVVINTVRTIILGFFSDEDGVMTDTEKTLLSVNKAVCNGVKELKPAQPQIIRCKGCKHQVKEWREDKRFKDNGYYACGCDIVGDACGYWALLGQDDDFCSRAERRTDEVQRL